MVEPFCKIEWHGEGRQVVKLYDGAALKREQLDDLCLAVADAIADAESIAALQAALDRVAEASSLRAQWLEGGTADPLDQVAAFTLWPISAQ